MRWGRIRAPAVPILTRFRSVKNAAELRRERTAPKVRRFYRVWIGTAGVRMLGSGQRVNCNIFQSILSTQHAAKGGGGGAEDESGQDGIGATAQCAVNDKGQDGQNCKVCNAFDTAPEEFACFLSFAGEEAGQEGRNYVDSYNGYRDNFFGEAKFI